jgi:hypothetical protein
MISNNQRYSTRLDEPRDIYGRPMVRFAMKKRIGVHGEGFSGGATPRMSRPASRYVAPDLSRLAEKRVFPSETPGTFHEIVS